VRKTFKTLLDRPGLRLLMLLSLFAVEQSATLAEEEKLFYFIDENGVTHLTNQPSDPRYKAFVPKKQGKERGSSSNGDDISPEEEIPPESEEPDQNSVEPMESPTEESR
jgi:hypothetical protein